MLNKWIIRTAVVLYIITFALNMGVVIHKDRSKIFEMLPESIVVITIPSSPSHNTHAGHMLFREFTSCSRSHFVFDQR